MFYSRGSTIKSQPQNYNHKIRRASAWRWSVKLWAFIIWSNLNTPAHQRRPTAPGWRVPGAGSWSGPRGRPRSSSWPGPPRWRTARAWRCSSAPERGTRRNWTPRTPCRTACWTRAETRLHCWKGTRVISQKPGPEMNFDWKSPTELATNEQHLGASLQRSILKTELKRKLMTFSVDLTLPLPRLRGTENWYHNHLFSK